ncbi:MAG: fructosamine kinase family protein [Bacteroidetes bacterium]|nr:fructosamine kinase family protein [Bacteroidota bacterium]
MLTEVIEKYIKQILAEKVQSTISSLRFLSVDGGSINETYKITINNTRFFFVKINDAQKFPSLFEKERSGLNFIAEQKIIRTPEVLHSSIISNYQILVLEWISQGLKSQTFWNIFGEALAKLHKVTSEDHGFYEMNYIGALPQTNQYTKNWIDFFIHQRLQPQINLAASKGLLFKKHIEGFEKLYPELVNIFEEENASLLHGDLWRGNFMCDDRGRPVLIDPAIYFGHRSMDLAMTTLFSGFDRIFYDSYNYHFPFPRNYQEQWDVCNLYPLLIHLNLFGSGYLHDIESVIKKF